MGSTVKYSKKLISPHSPKWDVYYAVCFAVGGSIWWVTTLTYGDNLNVKNKGKYRTQILEKQYQVEQLCCWSIYNYSYSIFKSMQCTKSTANSVRQESLSSCLLQHPRGNNNVFNIVPVGVFLPPPSHPNHWHRWVYSKRLSEMTFCYSPFGEKKKSSRENSINSTVLVFVKNKLLLILFSVRLLFFPIVIMYFWQQLAQSSMADSEVHREELHF